MVRFERGALIFAQGDPADSVLFLQEGRVKTSVHSPDGKEALLNILGAGEFFGAVCLNGVPGRTASAAAITDCTIVRLSVASFRRALRDDPKFCEWFVSSLLERSRRVHEYLADQLLNSTEQRLARTLLRLVDFGGENRQEAAMVSDVSQEMLASMVGTTRPRINHFMNKFRRLGLIEYSTGGVLVLSPLMRFTAQK